MATRRAVVIQGFGHARVVPQQVPSLRPDTILVKIKAVAINPTDWKALQKPTEGCVMGVDYSGVVECVTEGAVTREWKKGDRVAGSVHGSNPSQPEDGTFAEWTLCQTANAIKLPDWMSFEAGSTLGAGLISAGQALYQQLKLPLPNEPASTSKPVLIYGASTATGTLAVQLAKLSGMTVLATCSQKNFELVRTRGADFVFDYRNPAAIESIKKATGDQLGLIFDCVGEGGSPQFCFDAMGNHGGKYSTLLFPAECPRKDIELSMVMAYTAYGNAFTKFGRHFEANKEDYLFASQLFDICEPLLAAGRLIPHPQARREGGLDGILEGLEEMKAGKLSGQKLVYSI